MTKPAAGQHVEDSRETYCEYHGTFDLCDWVQEDAARRGTADPRPCNRCGAPTYWKLFSFGSARTCVGCERPDDECKCQTRSIDKFNDLPMPLRLFWMSMTAGERRTFRKYARMRGGDPVTALSKWIERQDVENSPDFGPRSPRR